MNQESTAWSNYFRTYNSDYPCKIFLPLDAWLMARLHAASAQSRMLCCQCVGGRETKRNQYCPSYTCSKGGCSIQICSVDGVLG
ncbi:hypothetical protein K438DRAFT_296549 [Mycena galopus ATCC 62051]|nr:hypothetical protein K438DRAFT_296549 [Mycena galopus ATCC 62051]